MCGTPHYLAPEIIKGTGYGIGADLWALGVLVYELLSGQTPFRARTQTELFAAILRGKPEPLPAAMRNGHGAALVKALLQPNVTKRHTMRQVMAHPWFTDPTSAPPDDGPDGEPLPPLDWGELERQALRSPLDKPQPLHHMGRDYEGV